MKNELMVKEFGGKEVRWSNKDKVNLVDVCKCCGLVKKNNNGKEYVRWNDGKGVTKKLQIIHDTDVPQEIKEEINNIIEEIEESDNRNIIFISNWLAKRLATECHSETAHQFKNWLVSLDCTREEIEKGNNYINQQQFMEYQNLINGALTTVAQQTMALVGQQTNLIGEQSSLIDKQTNLINKQAEEYANDREELKEFIGLRAKQVKELSHQLMVKVCSAYGRKVKASEIHWELNRDKLLNDNGYYRWEDIPVGEYENMKRKIMDFKIIIYKEDKEETEIKKGNSIEDYTDYKPTVKRTKKIETKVVDGVIYQKCTTCGKWKPQNKDNFYKDSRNPRGFKSQCKECKIGYYIANRDERLQHQKEYAKKIKPDLERRNKSYNSKYSNLNKDDDK